MRLHLTEDYDNDLFIIKGDTLVGVKKDKLPSDGELVIPENVKVLGHCCLEYCHIKKIQLPEGLIEIGSGALRNNDFTEITIPNGVYEIGNRAFEHTELKQITIPNSVNYFALSAFNGDKNLRIDMPLNLLQRTIADAKAARIFTGWCEGYSNYNILVNGKSLRYWGSQFKNSSRLDKQLLEDLKSYLIQNARINSSDIRITNVGQGCTITCHVPESETFIMDEDQLDKLVQDSTVHEDLLLNYVDVIEDFCDNNNLKVVSTTSTYMTKRDDKESSFWLRVKPGVVVTIRTK